MTSEAEDTIIGTQDLLGEATDRGVKGQAEIKIPLHPEDDLEHIKRVACNYGFLPDEESHEIEGRHMLTLTWHF